MEKNHQAKIYYVEKHLPYERQMLHHTYERINSCNDQMDWNAFFVSFVVYGRNLHDFLLNKREHDKRNTRWVANDFTDSKWQLDEPTENEVEPIMHTLHEEVLHLGIRKHAQAEQAGIGAAGELLMWIEKHWPTFIGAMRAEYRDHCNALTSEVSADQYVYSSGDPTGPTFRATNLPTTTAVAIAIAQTGRQLP